VRAAKEAATLSSTMKLRSAATPAPGESSLPASPRGDVGPSSFPPAPVRQRAGSGPPILAARAASDEANSDAECRHFDRSPAFRESDAEGSDDPLLKPPMTSRLAGRRLYIADLAMRLSALETGQLPMDAVGYRLLARRLRSALAGEWPLLLQHGFPELPLSLLPLLTEALEARHFDEHGVLYGPAAVVAQASAQAVLARLSRR
jgi:hypothetical protein